MDFEDILVVETTVGIAGPLSTRPLADLGARVVKIESTARLDNNRRRVPPPGMTAEQLMDVMNVHEMNAGKESVALNLKTESGRAGFLSLVREADVYVENFAPGWLARLGLSHEALQEINPRLIILAQSAYGEAGPFRSRRAYAPIMTALAGVESVVGYDEERIVPQMAGAVGDVVAAYYGLLSILAALRSRERTNRGVLLDMSQIEASACIAGIAFGHFSQSGQPPTPRGNADPRYVPHGIYRTAEADGWVALSIATDAQWSSFCDAVAVPGPAAGRYANRDARLEHRRAVDALAAGVLRDAFRDDVCSRLRAAGVPCAPVLDCYEAEKLPEFVARPLLAELVHPQSGSVLEVTRIPWLFDKTDLRPRRAFEGVGASTDKVMTEIARFEMAAISRAREEGAFA